MPGNAINESREGVTRVTDWCPNPSKFPIFTLVKPTISIEYCPKCGWMLRAAYFAQELLTTFTGDIHGVLLHPSEINGTFRISINGREIFERKKDGGFPEIKDLRQHVRDIVNPEKKLGHSERK